MENREPMRTTLTFETCLFRRLAIGAAVFCCVLLGLAWLVPTLGFARIHPWLPALAGLVCGGLALAVCGLTFGLLYAVRTGKSLWGADAFWRAVLRRLLPFLEMAARALDRLGARDERHLDGVRRVFIRINNDFVWRMGIVCAPSDLLILLPHCLQTTRCHRRLTHGVDNCARCGGCVVGGLLELRDRHGVKLAVAVGGTIARRIVRRERPRLIVAVACERDLASGIQDTAPLPVYGMLNQRPHGPCVDTTVVLEELDALVVRLLKRPEKA